ERDTGAGWEPAPPVWRAAPGDRLRVQTPGGGGFGSDSGHVVPPTSNPR
ncbi:MAG: hypothetical protein ACI8S6_003283, partial [Myxococcota bacterium]